MIIKNNSATSATFEDIHLIIKQNWVQDGLKILHPSYTYLHP